MFLVHVSERKGQRERERERERLQMHLQTNSVFSGVPSNTLQLCIMTVLWPAQDMSGLAIAMATCNTAL